MYLWDGDNVVLILYDNNVEFPQDLRKALELMRKRHIFISVHSRRVIVELITLYATEA